MVHVAIIGCGVVGAMIAYELSQIPGLTITVLDSQAPAQASTGAALGVLMGAISQKIKGKALQMRLSSIQRYDTLIPELEALTGASIPYNRHGILSLCCSEEDFSDRSPLVEIRRAQGWQLEILHPAQIQARYPQIQSDRLIAAIYSPQDRQVDPIVLTTALVTAAQAQGVTFKFQTPATVSIPLAPDASNPELRTCTQVSTPDGQLPVDWVVIAAGLGSTALTTALHQPVDIRPVLGQALQVRLDQPLGHPQHQPVITGEDVHIVPVGEREYWVGATVEFPGDRGDVVADPQQLEQVRQQAIAFCPALATATILRTWTGLRPRPEGRPAPVIGLLPGYRNVVLATGHYRNGVLLAPATTQAVRDLILSTS
ncbi:MAG: FAD-dependent oxidoreductase [Leptolyngbyaceae bacterium]|nr:FAD-dependent oxidoreductase [Leptolyngbyaceae bacterium]